MLPPAPYAMPLYFADARLLFLSMMLPLLMFADAYVSAAAILFFAAAADA
jgi:hypothetical protein